MATNSLSLLDIYRQRIQQLDPIVVKGQISKIVGTIVESIGPTASLGDLCYIFPRSPLAGLAQWQQGNKNVKKYAKAEVVGFRDNKVLLMSLSDLSGYSPGSQVVASHEELSIAVGKELLGRVLNGLGEPIDGKGMILTGERRPIHNLPPNPLHRQPIRQVLATGIKSIDSFITLGKGQRVGIFSGSGVGKSVLLGMIARNTAADVNVIALIGERGREVREFVERDLGPEGLKRSVVVAATSDVPPLIRLKGALVATTIAEYFRDLGLDVLLMMDSITRVAMAQREIGLAVGEPPTTKGYPPSTFSMLPKLLERAGNLSQGSITGLYAVLVEADDLNDPVADAVRSILDGHIVLSRDLAQMGHYPAVDPLQSVSRVMNDVVSEQHLRIARRVFQILATYREAQDLINIGAYVKGSNPKIDEAIAMIDRVNAFLRQDHQEKLSFQQTIQRLEKLLQN